MIEIYENEKPKDRYVVAEGFAEVTGERCTVLSTEAFEAGGIDRAQADARLEQAQLRLRDAEGDEERANTSARSSSAELLAAKPAEPRSVASGAVREQGRQSGAPEAEKSIWSASWHSCKRGPTSPL